MRKRKMRWISIMLSLVLISTVACVFPVHATGYHAFSVGTNYGSDDLNTSAHATTACAYYSRLMTSNYSIMPTTSIMFGNFSDGTPRIKSDILFFCGHANSTGMYFNYNNSGGSYLTGVYYTDSVYTSDGYYLIGLNNNMLNTQLITFAGCKTANGTTNLASKAHDYGAIASVGWTSLVTVDSLNAWLSRFNDYVTSSHSVQASVNYANSFTYNPLTGVKNAKIYGSNGWIPHVSDDGLVIPDNPDVDTVEEGGDLSESINAIIERLGLDRSTTDIRIYESYPGYYTIDFVQMIGPVETDSVYTAFIENYEVSEIIDHTYRIEETEKDSILCAVNAYSDSRHLYNMKLAIEAVDAQAEKKSFSQESCYYYKDGTLYEVVATDYYFGETKALGRDVKIFPIQ